VFNGFEGLLSGLFNAFNPDLKVIPYEGKFFGLPDETLKTISELEGVHLVSRTIEEVSLFEYKGSKEIGIIKGVDQNYMEVTRLDSLLISGTYLLKDNDTEYAIVGAGMRNKLSLSIQDRLSPLTVYMPQKKQKIIGAKEFLAKDIYPSGVFSVRSETDYQYLISNIEFVQKLVNQKNKQSSLEIKLDQKANSESIKNKISKILGKEFVVKNRYQQDQAYLKVMEIEKWFSFLIAGMTMLLIAFNLVGALWMIVLDKKKDIAVLKALGYDDNQIRKVFLNLGMLISLIGILLGFLLAIIAYYLQKNYGLIGIPEGFLIDSYPVKLKILDFGIVSLTVLLIGLLASILPASRAARSNLILKSQV